MIPGRAARGTMPARLVLPPHAVRNSVS